MCKIEENPVTGFYIIRYRCGEKDGGFVDRNDALRACAWHEGNCEKCRREK